MSDPKLISPLLDNYIMGDPISDRSGIRCCPAMKNDSDDKYIVKIISIPASQRQLDALLLTGAYPNAEAAGEYFMELSQGIVKELECLQQLSSMDGFLPYDSWQVVPMEDATGYDVYLLSSYKRSLEKHFQRTPMTHLSAVNLGLDLCAALAVARRSGFLYADLKPSNIFVTGKQSYRIGDIGFIRLDSLKYASLPDQYRSKYTAPEIADAFSSLNTTIDTYAVGLILYQTYNNGLLPFTGDVAPAEKFPAPEYADYEMAQIILKACDPDPAERWDDPIQMGQALVSYMQRNGVNDTPIVPQAVIEEDATEDDPQIVLPQIDETEPAEEQLTPEQTAQAIAQQDAAEESGLYVAEEPPEQTAETETEAAIPAQTAEPAVDSEAVESPYSEDDFGNLNFLDSLTEDETVQELAPEEISYEEISDEVSKMMEQADDLAAHEVPEPVVAPEAAEIVIPEPVLPVADDTDATVEQTEDTAAETESTEEDAVQADTPQETSEESDKDLESTQEQEDTPKKKKRHWLRNSIIIILILALLAGGYFFYKNYYLQPITAMKLDGMQDQLTVSIETPVNEELLSVVCADAYGNKIPAPVKDGKAAFTGLVPNTEYSVTVSIDGFHKLTGETSKTYYSPSQTKLIQLSAVTGSEDGSVIVGFTIDGTDSESWELRYSTAGEDEKVVSFTGHMVTVTGLTLDKQYTFAVSPVDELYVSGENEISFKASKLIYAQDLFITSLTETTLTASWSEPADTQVNNWSVRCYNDNGYSETITTQGTTVSFDGLDGSADYNVEVIAEGQSVSQRTYVGKNAITVSDLKADTATPGTIRLSWNASIQVPQAGWIVKYTVEDLEQEFTVKCTNNTLVLTGVVPGSSYKLRVQAGDDSPVICVPVTVNTPEAKDFSCDYQNFKINASHISLQMCKTPSVENWERTDLSKDDYTTTFSVGEKASFLAKLSKDYGISYDEIVTLYVIRDAQGKLVRFDSTSAAWSSMWYRYYGEMDIPALPEQPGEYTVYVYFNGAYAGHQAFTIQ